MEAGAQSATITKALHFRDRRAADSAVKTMLEAIASKSSFFELRADDEEVLTVATAAFKGYELVDATDLQRLSNLVRSDELPSHTGVIMPAATVLSTLGSPTEKFDDRGLCQYTWDCNGFLYLIKALAALDSSMHEADPSLLARIKDAHNALSKLLEESCCVALSSGSHASTVTLFTICAKHRSAQAVSGPEKEG